MLNKKVRNFKCYILKLPLKFFYLLTAFSMIFFSCSVDKQELRKQNKINKKNEKNEKRAKRIKKQRIRKLDNDFLAYYNTFYLAKIKFKNALEIEFQTENTNSPNINSANSYYDEATRFSDIIIDNFYNTEYINDAFYIKARSSYAKNILSPANNYFRKIVKDVNSPYYYDALVYLGFISLKLEDIENLSKILLELDINIENFNNNISFLHKKKPYKFIKEELLNVTSNYYLLKAESSIYFETESSKIEEYFLLSINASKKKNQILKTYNRILNFYRELKNDKKILEYLNILIQESSSDDLSEEIIKDWLHYGREQGEYEVILKFIDEKLDKGLSIKDELFYLIEKSKTYYHSRQLLESINILKSILEDYEDYMSTYKIYFSDIYFELGKIYLKEYLDFEESLNYFNLSSEKDISNLDAKKYSNSINLYLEILDNYEIQLSQDGTIIEDVNSKDSLNTDNKFYIPLPSNYRYSSTNNLDTLLFDMARILHFNLELDSIALKKLELLYFDYIDSPLIPQVLMMLNRIEPDTKWQKNFPGNLQSILNFEDMQNNAKINNRRKIAFEKMNISLYEAIDLFEKNYNQYNDLFSLYMVGFIYDVYIKDIYKTVYYYKKYIENEDADKYIQVKSRLANIENLLDSQLKIVNQKISYNNAINYINGDSLSLDSLSIDLEECKIGPNKYYKEKCRNLIEVIDFPMPDVIRDSLSINLINKWSNGMTMDERLFTLANIIKEESNNLNLAKSYYQLIIQFYNNSEYINEVYFSLQNLDNNINWKDSLLVHIKKNNDLMDDFIARTGSDVVSAVNNRLQPLDLASKNKIYEIYLDSINSDVDINNLLPLEIYDFQFKQNVFIDKKVSKQNYLISMLSNFEAYDMHYSLSDNKIFQWEPNFEVARELSPESYLLTPNITFVKSALSNIKMTDRYNINNSEADCEYLGEGYKCYEIEVIPSENDYYKTLWILKIEQNNYMLIKEQSFDLNSNILTQIDLEYIKLDPYYIVNKIIETDFKNKVKKIQTINSISVNNGLSDDIFNFNKKNNLNLNTISLENLYIEGHRLDSIYHLLFYVPEPLDTISNIDTLFINENEEEHNLFSFNQSINQYFYFIEDASINGIELTNNDWLVSYNDDVIVGARKYVEGGMIDIPIMGYDNSSENTKIATDGYCQTGDIPIIKVFRSNGEFINMDVILVDGKLEFQSIGHATVILKED